MHRNVTQSADASRASQAMSPRGYTLLELILALSLSIVVMAAVGTAIHLNLRVLAKSRTTIERTQLARSVMQLIANDLRDAMQFQTTDMSDVPSLSMDDAMSELMGDDPESAETGMEDELETVPLETAGSTVIPLQPGLIGYQFELHVDISRLPRPDEYDAALSGQTVTPDMSLAATSIPSDIKTVSYFVQPAGMAGPTNTATDGVDGVEPSAASYSPGLVRRELSRAITSWAYNNGTDIELQSAGKVVAPEVVQLEFQYFDGLNWQASWNSDEMQSLPLAVEIFMAVQPQQDPVSPILDLGASAAGEMAAPELYRMVVHLPAADPKTEEELLEMEEEMLEAEAAAEQGAAP